VLSRPLIGVTTSEIRPSRLARPLAEADPNRHEMALGMVYMRAVERGDGLPVVLPPLSPEAICPLVAHLHGLCLSGGPDLDPHGYGAEPHPELGPVEPDLDAFELAVAREADRLGLPILGICRGAQALNVSRGGTLHQHIPDITDGSLRHRQEVPGNVATHEVEIDPSSRLARLMGVTRARVNSFHHQAIDRLGEGLRAVAWSPDGLVEAVEGEDERLVLGVQWHAEGLVDRPEDLALFRALTEAACEHERAAEQAA
jgi:putative glutamine amidotransferase